MTVAVALAAFENHRARATDSIFSRFGAQSQSPHPAVCRIITQDADGQSLGSGTLIAKDTRHAMVITNWHVIADATGSIEVRFPDGFRSAAQVLKADRVWDLAALLIWPPPANPIDLATQAPKPGDVLTIAGYGPGPYRAVSGRCTQYMAPSDHDPFEIVELSATARQGDSGGPILNGNGQLAGVLFGSDSGTTSGSYSGRVRQFLATLYATPRAAMPPLQDNPSPAPQSLAGGDTQPSAREMDSKSRLHRLPSTFAVGTDPALTPLPPSLSRTHDLARTIQRAPEFTEPQTASDPAKPAPPQATDWRSLFGSTWAERTKTTLALIGLLAIIARLRRLRAQPD